MPISYTYDRECNILYENGSGEVTFEDFVNYRMELLSGGLQPNLRCLIDYTSAQVNFSFNEMVSLMPSTRQVSQAIGSIKAAICASDDLGFGMACMYSALIGDENIEVMVFRNLKDARVWLGIEGDEESNLPVS